MSRAITAQVERARQLLAHEGAASTDHCAAAAEQVYNKLDAQLALLLGSAGVQALFRRSAKLAQGELAGVAQAVSCDDAAKLRECLQALDPAVAAEAAVVLFGTFFTLVATFIGERLTTEALRSAWPTIETASRKIEP